MQKLERHCGGYSSGDTLNYPRTYPIELEKAEPIKFSGKPEDFATFKHEFNDIIISIEILMRSVSASSKLYPESICV